MLVFLDIEVLRSERTVDAEKCSSSCLCCSFVSMASHHLLSPNRSGLLNQGLYVLKQTACRIDNSAKSNVLGNVVLYLTSVVLVLGRKPEEEGVEDNGLEENSRDGQVSEITISVSQNLFI